ncbi:PAS domain-containing protein [Flavihumibacter sp. R14]|nr:PAS domain-containing protein [Flavihumibacter soli]
MILLSAATLICSFLIVRAGKLKQEVESKTRELAEQNNYRQQAEALAEANKVLFDVAVEGVGLGVFTWILATREISYNQKWASIMGYNLSEIEQNSTTWLSHIHPEEVSNVKSNIIFFLRSGEDHYQFEHRVRTKSGDWKWIMAYLKVQERNEAGKALKVTGVHLDIDDMKAKQLELHKITRELMHSNTELQKFAYITSHNLRAPAVNLLSLSELFNFDKPDDELNREIINKIHRSSRLLNDTLNDLIEIVSNKPGCTETKEDLDLAEETDHVLNSIEYLLKQEKAEINVNFDDVPQIKYSRKVLHSVLLNLISNALKYRSTDRQPVINISSYQLNGLNYLDVKDNGQGIDLNRHQTKIFGLYQRFSRKPEGKGLGLFIVKSQIESMNGTISVDSKVDQGTTFTIGFNKFEYN